MEGAIIAEENKLFLLARALSSLPLQGVAIIEDWSQAGTHPTEREKESFLRFLHTSLDDCSGKSFE